MHWEQELILLGDIHQATGLRNWQLVIALLKTLISNVIQDFKIFKYF